MPKVPKPDLDEVTARIAKTLLSTPPKRHEEMKLGKVKAGKKERSAKTSRSDKKG